MDMAAREPHFKELLLIICGIVSCFSGIFTTLYDLTRAFAVISPSIPLPSRERG
jgi:hypothetical protein